MDLTLNVFRIPEAGETVTDDGGVAYTPGGLGARCAAAFARLGADSVFCTKLGADAHGQRLYSYYKEIGINTSEIKVDHDCPTALSVLIRENNGDTRVVSYPGACGHLTTENIMEAFSSDPDALCLSFDLSPDAMLTASKIARGKGIPIFVDAQNAKGGASLSSLPELEIFSTNEEETYKYTGVMPQGAESSLKAVLLLSRQIKAKYFVIKMGARGAFVYDGKHYNVIPPCRTERNADMTNQTDLFFAAMTAEYLRSGGDIEKAVRCGAAANSLSV